MTDAERDREAFAKKANELSIVLDRLRKGTGPAVEMLLLDAWDKGWQAALAYRDRETELIQQGDVAMQAGIAKLVGELKDLENRAREIHIEGWISVEERLPEDYGQFLVCGIYKDQDGDLVSSTATDRWDIDEGWGADFPVTHWRPLPAPPEGKEPPLCKLCLGRHVVELSCEEATRPQGTTVQPRTTWLG